MYKFTVNAGQSPKIMAGGLVRAGRSLTLPLERVTPSITELVDAGSVTADPVLPAHIIEAGKTVKNLNALPLNRPVQSTKDIVRDSARAMTEAVAEAARASQVVFDSDNTPQAKATGVTLNLEIQDSSGDPQTLNSAFEVFISVAGSGGSTNAAGFTITPLADNVVPGTGNEDKVRFVNGRAQVNVKAADAGEATVSMVLPSRSGVTISDTQIITLT